MHTVCSTLCYATLYRINYSYFVLYMYSQTHYDFILAIYMHFYSVMPVIRCKCVLLRCPFPCFGRQGSLPLWCHHQYLVCWCGVCEGGVADEGGWWRSLCPDSLAHSRLWTGVSCSSSEPSHFCRCCYSRRHALCSASCILLLPWWPLAPPLLPPPPAAAALWLLPLPSQW